MDSKRCGPLVDVILERHRAILALFVVTGGQELDELIDGALG
jgi:hypothetical protein